MQKHVNLVDLVKSFPTNIFLQNLASIQQRTNLIKFDHLDEKSEEGSISNLSTKVYRSRERSAAAYAEVQKRAEEDLDATIATNKSAPDLAQAILRSEVNIELNFPPQTWRGSFSAVSTPIFASKYALESSRRDLHNALLCTVL